ncbi:hypothetical protein IEQ34_004844 [Dendrobium chrysotoxum]|uniref:Uncharacterized protein n=1 Tax=Dendrobium chrysotoxum TaxID=161865 RepID=A0AAV7H759_DENCH|nr:hypothetical protein IEQ34_004844 [Dendrobium chrysotoxum]
MTAPDAIARMPDVSAGRWSRTAVRAGPIVVSWRHWTRTLPDAADATPEMDGPLYAGLLFEGSNSRRHSSDRF